MLRPDKHNNEKKIAGPVYYNRLTGPTVRKFENHSLGYIIWSQNTRQLSNKTSLQPNPRLVEQPLLDFKTAKENERPVCKQPQLLAIVLWPKHDNSGLSSGLTVRVEAEKPRWKAGSCLFSIYVLIGCFLSNFFVKISRHK